MLLIFGDVRLYSSPPMYWLNELAAAEHAAHIGDVEVFQLPIF